MAIRARRVFAALLLSLCAAPLVCAAPAAIEVTEAFTGRVRALYCAQGASLHHYPQMEFLERSGDLRFIYVRDCDPAIYGNDESAAICDGILWDSASYFAKLAERAARLDAVLARRKFDILFLDGKKFPVRTAEAIARYVEGGGTAVWLGAETVEEGPLAPLCPFEKTEQKAAKNERFAEKLPRTPLLGGLPLERMVEGLRFPAVVFKKGVVPLLETSPRRFAGVGVLTVGKGTVWATAYGMVPAVHRFADPDRPETDRLWSDLWGRVGAAAKSGGREPARIIDAAVAPAECDAGAAVEATVSAIRGGPKAVSLALEDVSGRRVASATAAPGTAARIAVPATAPSGLYRLTAAADGARAYAFLRVNGRVSVELTPDRPGCLPGEKIAFSAAVGAGSPLPCVLRFAVHTPYGRLVAAETRKAEAGAAEPVSFALTMPEMSRDCWAYRAAVVVESPEGARLAEASTWVWDCRPWTMREKFLFSNYFAGQSGVPASLMPLFARYHRGVGYNGGHHWQEPYYSRFGMRAWYQWGATRMEIFTRNFAMPDFSHLAEQAAGAFKGAHKTAAYVLQDFGEETGFYYHWSNNPFARTWKEDKDIPAGAHKLFRVYLRERYGDIARLNAEWETAHRSFDDIFLQTKNGLPAGWLHGKAPADVPANIAPLLDTHGFFFWYTRNVAEGLTGSLRKLNPVSDWTMSFSLTFNLFSPVPMTMVHPMYNARLLVPWHANAVARSRGGDTPVFSFHWGFDEDYRAWGQFWNQNLAALSTFMSNWGSQFNCDMTHSRSTILLKRLLARVRPRERFFLDCRPVASFDVGLYHPDLDWQTVHSRPSFYLRGQGPDAANMGQLGFKPVGTGWLGGPEFQIHNVIADSGYVVRWVLEDEIPACKVLVVPYVETMPETAAARIRDFVSAGGTLVTMPVLATHNGYGRPYKEVPGGGLAAVLGLTVDPAIIGQRAVVVPDGGTVLPMKFTPRMGSEPPYLWSFGHQRVLSTAPDTQVLCKLYDGNPAITLRRFGKGTAVHLNMFTFDHFSQYEASAFQNESLRQLFANIISAAGVEPYLSVGDPFRYGVAVENWATYQYQLTDSPVRVLAIYADKGAQTTPAEVAVRGPVAEVIDILGGKPVPLRPRAGGATVEELDPFAFTKAKKAVPPAAQIFGTELAPGDVAFYALVPYRTGAIDARLAKAAIDAGKEPLRVAVEILTAEGKPVPGAHPVHVDVFGPGGEALPEYGRRVTLRSGATVTIPTLPGGPDGAWTIRVTDALTGRSRTLTAAVRAAKTAGPAVADIFGPSAVAGPIAVSDREFTGLLDALTAVYLTGGDRDKGALSFYAHDRDASRHRIMQLLLQTDWRTRLPLLRKHLSSGKTVILTGEDLGVDPVSGISLEPLAAADDAATDVSAAPGTPRMRGSGILAALGELAGRDLSKPWGRTRLVVPVGKGRLILDRTSFDELGQTNAMFDANHRRWLTEMERETGVR